MLYADLLTRVSSTLGGQISTTQVSELVEVVEARFNRIINAQEREITATKTVATYSTLPTDCWQVRDVYLSGTADVTLEQMSPDSARRIYGSGTGEPRAYAITGTTLILFPAPTGGATFSINIRYQKTIPGLTTTNTSNWLLAGYPDIYYYSMLLQSEAFIANDERIPMWKAALDEALKELESLSVAKRYGPSPLVRRAQNVA